MISLKGLNSRIRKLYSEGLNEVVNAVFGDIDQFDPETMKTKSGYVSAKAYKNEKIAEALATKLETWQKLKDQYGDDKEAILEAFVATGGKEEYYKWLDTVGPKEISDTRLKQDWLVQNDYEAGRIVRQMASWGKDLRAGVITTSQSRERLSGIVSRAKNLRR